MTLHMNQVYGLFWTSIPGIFAVGDVAAFPLKVEYSQINYHFPINICNFSFYQMTDV